MAEKRRVSIHVYRATRGHAPAERRHLCILQRGDTLGRQQGSIIIHSDIIQEKSCICPPPRLFAAAFAVAVLAACSDTPQRDSLVEPERALEPSANAHRNAQLQRSGGGRNWAHASPEELWREISQTDSTLIVGLTAPGQRRGVRNGEVAISRTEWDEARRAVIHLPGVALVDEDTILPTLRVKVEQLETVRRLNRLPFVDYLEPAVILLEHPESFLAGFGCRDDGGSHWSGELFVYERYGDYLPQNYPAMSIPKAWRQSPKGAGVTIGIIDTGLDHTQPEMNELFASGASAGRELWRDYSDANSGPGPGWTDTCGHGTHQASVIAAPMNGRNIVGVAWEANLVAIRHDSDVFGGWDVWTTNQAIDLAAGRYDSRIISMAFGTADWIRTMEDKIRYWYNRGVLFIAAAGTSDCAKPFLQNDVVIFPAEMDEVVAVTGVDPDGRLLNECSLLNNRWETLPHYGPEVELAAVIRQPATGSPLSGDGPMRKQVAARTRPRSSPVSPHSHGPSSRT